MPAVLLAGKIDLHTAYDTVISRFFQGHAFSHHAFNRRGIVEKLWMAVACTDTFHGLDL